VNSPEEAKDLVQENAVLFSKSNKHLLLTWATGVGKTLAALKIIREHLKNPSVINKWYIICEELSHIENWKREITYHKYDDILPHIEFFCYASLHKYINTKANLVLDECHHVSDNRLNSIQGINSTKVVSLSATVDDKIKAKLNLIHPIYEYNIPVSEAIQYGILPEPNLYVVYFELDNINKTRVFVKKKGRDSLATAHTAFYDTYINVLKDLKKNKVDNYRVLICCTELEYYQLLSQEVDYWKECYYKSQESWHKTLWLRKSLERKKFLAQIKAPLVKKIIDVVKHNNNRFICFTGSIDQARELSIYGRTNKKVGRKPMSQYVCSQHSSTTNNRIIDSFNKKKIDSIYAVEMLRESVTLTDINAGIITQLDSGQLSFVQMLGRTFRSSNPILFVTVADGTKDVDYLANAINGMDPKYISYIQEKDLENYKSLICPRNHMLKKLEKDQNQKIQ